MATPELKSFLENRLRALDPSIDLELGSPAQLQFIEPVVSYLGTDPFETDIQKFLDDRFSQEFPDLYADNPGVVRDVFANPLRLLLEPFKREIQSLRRGQSWANPELLSDEDVEALAGNFFEERDSGGRSTGSGRVYFPNPRSAQAEVTTRFYTSGGLSFMPTHAVSITAEEMAFNREGSLYFFDVPLQAEQDGAEYNIDAEALVGVEGLYGTVRVTNLRAFKNGTSQLDTASFIAGSREALTERSLNNRRGASARIRNLFQTDVRAVQVIGARDPEMQRDLLVAASPGHAWIQGVVYLYGRIGYVQAHVIDGSEGDVPRPGDELFVYLSKYAWPGLQQDSRFVRLKVEELLGGPYVTTDAPIQASYLVRTSGDFPAGLSIPRPLVAQGGFSKKGTVRISSLPDIGETSLSVPNGQVHVYGHTDVYVRPVLPDESSVVLNGLYDEKSFIEATALESFGEEVSDKNRVRDTAFDFAQEGVSEGDVLILETGDDAGSYVIARVAGSSLWLDANLTQSRSALRYRIQKGIRLDAFEPKTPRFPFSSALANDLSTVIESNLFVLATNDILSYGAKAGDVIRVKSGTVRADYVIQGFDPVLGGRGLLVDRPAQVSETGLSYEVFSPLSGLERPFVRLKEMMLLDASQQTTGIVVPPAEPVAVVPVSDFTTARVRGSSQRKSGFVLPSLAPSLLATYLAGPSQAAPSGDRRYSLGFDAPEGIYKPFYTVGPDTSRDYFEFSFRDDASEGCSYFLAVHEFSDEAENFPPVDPKPGECLYLRSGPNQGGYLIKSVHRQKYKLYSPARTAWVYFIQVYGTFPVDIFREVIDMLNSVALDKSAACAVTELPITGEVEFPKFFVDLYESFGDKLHEAFRASALTVGGLTPPASALQAIFEGLTQVDYEWGDAARGLLRSYFQAPVLFEQRTGEADEPTVYEFLSSAGEVVRFRPDPARYGRQELVPARVGSDANPLTYPRDGVFGGASVVFTDDGPSMLQRGVRVGDWLDVHEEVVLHGSPEKRTAVLTVAGSAQVKSPVPGAFGPSLAGALAFFEQGADAGGYRVVRYIDSSTLLLERVLGTTTPNVLLSGSVQGWGKSGGVSRVTCAAAVSEGEKYVGSTLTLYAVDARYQGSYLVTGFVPGTNPVWVLDGQPGLPEGSFTGGIWLMSTSPTVAMEQAEDGTLLHGAQPVRFYQAVPRTLRAESVSYADADSSGLLLSGAPVAGVRQPYRIWRQDVRRVSPSEMAARTEGPFCYFDTEVVSVSPHPSANLKRGSYLTPLEGSYVSHGWRHEVGDETLTYSVRETGKLTLPCRLLPAGSADSPENYLSLVGAPVQLTYEKADVVSQVQDFVDSPQDRNTSANMLVRHFLPAYVSYDAHYAGGSAPGVVARDIIAYINTLPPESALDVSEVQNFITRRGGNPDTPTRVMALLHDWRRRAWLEMSEDRVGGSAPRPPYAGSPRVVYYTSGPDVSEAEEVPAGERVLLTRS